MEDNQITDNDKEDDKQDCIELVQRTAEGDKEAFTHLYTLTYSEVYHIVTGYCTGNLLQKSAKDQTAEGTG